MVWYLYLSETPVDVYEEDGKWYAEFDKCLSGWPELKIHDNTAGDEIKLQYWEVQTGWGNAGYDTYLCKGGEETFDTPFVRHTSFKVIEITGYEGELTADDITGIVAYSKTENNGRFESSDERLNKVFTMSERSGRQNIQQGIISVDANREQSPWTADSWNIGIGTLYNHQDTMLIDKIIKDYAGDQRDDGSLYTCSPGWQYNGNSPEWSMYWPMMLWQEYLFKGDLKLLEDTWENFSALMAYLMQYENTSSGLYNPTGWRISDYAGGVLQSGGENIATNCQLYMNFGIAAQVARLIGHDSDAELYEEKAAQLKDNINYNLLIDGERYATTPGNSQTVPLASAWALRSGVAPAVFEDRIIGWFADQCRDYNVGGYGGDALYSGLYEANLGHIATPDYARYDRMLESNNTNWESFGELSGANMGNHAWTAYPSYLLPKYVGGVQPTDGGFSAVDIKPVIGGLDWAKVTTPTVKGDIEVSWKQDSETQLTMEVTIPANVQAQIFVPDNDMSGLTVTESGNTVYAADAYVDGVDGITGAAYEDGYVVVSAGSGTYSFTITGTPKNTPPLGPGEEDNDGWIVDELDALKTGDWAHNVSDEVQTRYGVSFAYAGGVAGAPTASAVFTFNDMEPGTYDVFAWWTTHANRATDAPYAIAIDGETAETVRCNQEIDGGRWNLLGTYEVTETGTITVTLTNDANEFVIADAVRVAPHKEIGDDEEELTPQQELLLCVYEMGRKDTSFCIHPVLVQKFKDTLAQTRILANSEDLTEEEAQEAKSGLEAAYEALEQWSKPEENLALNGTVTASTSEEAAGLWLPEYLTDGYLAKDNSGRVGFTTPPFTEKVPDEPVVLTVDMGEVKELNNVTFFPRLGSSAWNGKTSNFMSDYTVELSVDGTDWVTVADITDQPDPNFKPVEVDFAAAQAQYIRIVVTELGEYAGDEHFPGNPTPYRLQLSEIEAYMMPERYTVSVDYEPDGGTVEGITGKIPKDDSEITLTAVPNDGWRFNGWYLDGQLVCETPEYTFIVNRDYNLEAQFQKPSSNNSYRIVVTQTEGGKIAPSSAYVKRGGSETFTITPDEGYRIADVLVDGKSVGAVSSYTFENVKAKHTITAEFTKDGEAAKPVAGFSDVKTDDWFAEAVQYVVDKGLMNGTSDTAFSPKGDTTRGMIVTILYRQAGSPEVESDGKTWWSDARVWAMANGVSDGTNMEKPITREQLVTMLHRYTELTNGDVSKTAELEEFRDAGKVSAYAVDAMKWAVGSGIINGRTGGIIDPQAGATRAETAAMFMRLYA